MEEIDTELVRKINGSQYQDYTGAIGKPHLLFKEIDIDLYVKLEKLNNPPYINTSFKYSPLDIIQYYLWPCYDNSSIK